MLNHKVTIRIEEQVAVTRVEQTFRNHTDRQLEATYVFPVPKGASVNRFTMWVDGKETKGELVPADKAREIYTSIVRRTQDPGLLEYMGNDMLRLRVFPVPAKGDQKVAVSYTAVAPKEGKLVEYIYPLKTDGKAVQTLEKFSIAATVKSEHGVMNVYSPTHPLTLTRVSDKEVVVSFDRDQGSLDRDFQLFYSTGKDDVGLTALAHRPISTEKGFFTILISPRMSLSEKHRIPQDMVFVMDTSGSMRGKKMDQARNALKYCLGQLHARDRFALFSFATTVNPYEEKLLDASSEQVAKARKWVDELEATGGTAINSALEEALELRSKDDGSSLHDRLLHRRPADHRRDRRRQDLQEHRREEHGQYAHLHLRRRRRCQHRPARPPGRKHPGDQHLRSARGRHRPEGQRACTARCRNPVLTNLKLPTTADVRFSEIYPPEMPDLFHGGQLVVMGRVLGQGASAIKLTGKVGKETKEFAYDLTFPDKTDDSREFVEQLWARRKVGYLARPDPRQRREGGAERRGHRPGQEVRHHDAVHQLPDRAGWPTADHAGPSRWPGRSQGARCPGPPGKGTGGGGLARVLPRRPFWSSPARPKTRPRPAARSRATS